MYCEKDGLILSDALMDGFCLQIISISGEYDDFLSYIFMFLSYY